jgi:hypothetical protein
MAGPCVGCGLAVVDGVLVVDLDVLSGYVEYAPSYMVAAPQLLVAAPNPSVAADLDSNIGVIQTELAALTVDVPERCSPVTFMIQAGGRTRLDVTTSSLALFTGNNEVRNEIRVNGGPWEITDLTSFFNGGDDPAEGRSYGWHRFTPTPPVVVAPGGQLVIDRRAVFRWEDNMITANAVWNMPAISVVGF